MKSLEGNLVNMDGEGISPSQCLEIFHWAIKPESKVSMPSFMVNQISRVDPILDGLANLTLA